jgi:hypothetical protein
MRQKSDINDAHAGVFVTVGLLAKISPVYLSQVR